MDMRGCLWMLESFLRNDKWEIKFLTLEQQNKGPVISREQSYITPMISCDIMWCHRHDRGGGVGLGGWGLYENTQVYQFSPNPSQKCVKIFYVISYLTLSKINLMQCT